jgi:hypothetical protein
MQRRTKAFKLKREIWATVIAHFAGMEVAAMHAIGRFVLDEKRQAIPIERDRRRAHGRVIKTAASENADDEQMKSQCLWAYIVAMLHEEVITPRKRSPGAFGAAAL